MNTLNAPTAFNPDSLTGYRPRRSRRVLCAFPRYSKSFGTFDHAFELMGPVQAFMPPQGMLLIAALLPPDWEVRFVDENVRRIRDEEFEWADAVFISGMHIQRGQIEDINDRAHCRGCVTALGGPSVSAAPDFYPEIDLLHCGEVGDATFRLFERIDALEGRPARQEIFRTVERLPMHLFPAPAYRFIDINQYLLGSVSFSSGCPFTCEFCDIPALYGRNPRQKTPGQILRELDALAQGGTPSIYFVDDNFIANPKAALELLPHLIEWQRRWDYSVRLSCEATLNITQHPRILEQMREAGFTNIFCGVESPETEALRAMGKRQNLRSPVVEAVETLNRYGMEVAAGIIMGLDTDTEDTAGAIIEFTRATAIPILTVNILYALPKTRLYERLERTGRLNADPDRESNVEFLRSYETVVTDWRRVIRAIYDPAALYERYAVQAARTYPNRVRPRHPLRQLTWRNVSRGVDVLARMVRRVGVQSDYRRLFWDMAAREVRRGCVENVFQIAMVAHHLITYGRETVAGIMQASNYSTRQAARNARNHLAPRPAPAVAE